MRWKLLLLGLGLFLVSSVSAQDINPQLQELLIEENRMSCMAGFDEPGAILEKLEAADPAVLQSCTSDTSHQCSPAEFKSMVCTNLQIGKKSWQIWVNGDYHDCRETCEMYGVNGDRLIRLYESRVTPNEPTSTPAPLPQPTTVPKDISYCTQATGDVSVSCTSTGNLTTIQGCDAVALNKAIDALPSSNSFWNCGRVVDQNADNETRADALVDCAILQYQTIDGSWGGGSEFVCHQNWVVALNGDGEYVPENVVIDDRAARDLFVERILKKNIETGAITEIPDNYDIVTPTPVDAIRAFEENLNKAHCGVAGAACCAGGVVFDGQAPPDFSDGTDARKTGFFTQIFESIEEKFNTLFRGSQYALESVITGAQGVDFCPADESIPNYYEVTSRDANGGVTGKAELSDEETKTFLEEKVIPRLLPLVSDRQKITINDRKAIWEGVRGEFDTANYACDCELREGEAQVQGASTDRSGQVLGEYEDEILRICTEQYPDDGSDLQFGTKRLSCYEEFKSICDDYKWGGLNCLDEVQTYCKAKAGIGLDFARCYTELNSSIDTAASICDPLNNDKLKGNDEEYQKCYQCVLFEDGVWTAFGCMYSDFGRTINEKIFGVVLGIAGMITLGCIIYASFLMQTSAGNPERTGKAQELMTSCITGLIIIIFSVFILRVIGVDILRIPGFGSSDSTSVEEQQED